MSIHKNENQLSSIIQNHSGTGHNFGDNTTLELYYHKAVTIDNLTDIAEDLVYMISTDDSDSALQVIKTYQNFANLPEEANNLFTALTGHINLSKNKETSFDTDALKRLIRKSSIPELQELYKALLIKVTFNKEGLEQAKEIYRLYSNSTSYYLKAVYDSLLASYDELASRYTNDIFGLDNYELFTLAQGLWRFDRFEEVNIVLERISSGGVTSYIECLLIASDYNNVVKVPNLQSYAYLPTETARSLKHSIDRFLKIISSKDKLSSSELDLLIPMTNGFGPYIHKLISEALRFKNDIAKKDPEMGEWLELISSQRPIELSPQTVEKLHKGGLLEQAELFKCLTALKHNVLNVKIMETWLDSSGKVIDSDKIFMNFLKVFILSFKHYEETSKLIEYRNLLDNFIKRYSKELRSISAIYIMAFIDNLYSLGNTFEVPIYNILEKVCQNIAVESELYPYYLKSLLRLGKFETIKREFDRIEKNEWTNELYSIHARYLLEVPDYEKALTVYQKFIDVSNNLYFWHNYLFCCYKSSRGLLLAQQELIRIPKELFSISTLGFDFFVMQIGNFIDYIFIEKLLIELFAQNPNEYARIFTRFYLNGIVAHKGAELNEVEDYDGVHQGLVYEINGERRQGLLVDNWLAVSKYKELIDITMPIGKMLENMDEDEFHELDYDDIRLVARQEITTTVFQLAIQITHESQHNFKDKIFYMFNTTEATAHEDFQKIVQKIDRNDNTDSLINNPEIPLYMKGQKIGGSHVSSSEFETAYRLLLNQSTNVCLTFPGGSSLVSESMVIDIYSFIYLCLSNIYKSVVASKITIYISHETDATIALWLNKITHENFKRIYEVDGELIGMNSDFIKNEFNDFINDIKILQAYTKVEIPNVHDLPTIVSQIDNLISSSIISSIKLSVSKDVPWLCLDSLIRNTFTYEGEIKVVNFTHFVEEHINRPFLTFNDRKQAMTLWAYTGLYTLYSYQDLLTLAQSTNDLPLLTKLLNDTPLNFPTSDIAENLLGNILETISLKTYFFANKPIEYTIIEGAIYACLKKGLESLEYETQEERVGRLIPYIIAHFSFESVIQHTLTIVAKFASGHFMDINEINKVLHSQISNIH